MPVQPKVQFGFPDYPPRLPKGLEPDVEQWLVSQILRSSLTKSIQAKRPAGRVLIAPMKGFSA
jgi:hypothetical protein